MKHLILIAIAMTALTVQAEEQYYLVNGKKVDTKVEALIAKVKDTKTVIHRCQEQELSSKGTLKNK